MDYIKRIADEFIKYNIQDLGDETHIINSVKNKLLNIHEAKDQIKYLNLILEANAKEYENHLIRCTNLDNCLTNMAHESILYNLTQELKKLGVSIDNDAFTNQEKTQSDIKLDIIIEEIQKLKDGHQIIYDDLIKEINDLKELYYLGKKKWHRQLLGTGLEMTASGVISETLSKSVIDVVKKLPTLL